jgi:succinoglycan biosynthesis transport protein ExoP
MNDIASSRIPRPNLIRDTEAAAPNEASGEMPILMRVLRLAKRWKWVILGAIVVSLIGGLTVTLLMTPLYTASATVEIQRENKRIVNVQGVEPEANSVDLEFYQTQYGLLTSRSLAERVARVLKLHQSAAFFEMFGAKEDLEDLQSRRPLTAADQQKKLQNAADILLKRVNIKPERMSRLVDIEFTSPDPQFSARVVNEWTKGFVETTLERRFEATSYARRFLEQRLTQLRQRLEESERALVSYATRERIVNIPLTTTTGADSQDAATERPLVAEDLATLNRSLNEAVALRVAAESRLRGSGGATTEALQNQAISMLRQRRTELQGEYARLMSQFQPEYPPARALQQQIQQIDRGISREEGQVRSTLEATYRAAAAQETALKSRVEQLRRDLLDLRGRTIQYNIYQREVDTNRQLYDGLLQRYKEIGVAGGVGVNNIVVVDDADVPEKPSSPRILVNMVVSLLLGLGLGAALALALDQIDEAISDPTDVERMLGVPLLGAIPKVEPGALDAALRDRKSALVEAYLSAQTRLAFTTDHGVPRTVVVTSTRPAEGKSTTSSALARMLARTGRSVILVDADMRAPSLHSVFGLSNERGLSSYLSGNADLSAIVHRDMADGIALMTAGPLPPNAAELLTGDRIVELIDGLTEMFDHVILDAPPVMGLADSPLIASRAEGVVFVVESHATRVTTIRVALARLADANVRILGALLTKFESNRAHYGYGYEYGYGYGAKSDPQT